MASVGSSLPMMMAPTASVQAITTHVPDGSAPRQTADRSYIPAEYLYLSEGGRHCRIEHRSARSGRPSALSATGGFVRHPPRLLPARTWGRGRPGRRSMRGTCGLSWPARADVTGTGDGGHGRESWFAVMLDL